MPQAPHLNGNGKKTILDSLSGMVPLFFVIGSLGGMALTPLYILSHHSEREIEDMRIELKQHMSLPSHPVMAAKFESEMKRMDDRIKANDDLTASVQKSAIELETKFSENKAETGSKFVEVETQVDAMAQSLNIQFAEGQRKTSDIQNALHDLGATIPTTPQAPYYFPNISNRTQGHK